MVEVNQEQLIRIQLMEQEVNQLNEQLRLIDEKLSELKELLNSLEKIEEGSKEIKVNLGNRIFIPVSISEKKLIVDVGKGTFVKRSIPETKMLIEKQIDKLNNAKNEIMNGLEFMHKEIEKVIKFVESKQENRKRKE